MGQDEELSLLLRTIYTAFYFTIMVFGVCGNAMVIIVIFKVKDMLNATNIFLANLAITDLLTLVTWGAVSIIDVNYKRLNVRHLHKSICFGLPLFKDTLLYAAVLTILAISFDRYFAICQPLKAGYICTKNRAYKICLLVWVFAFLSASWRFSFTFYVQTGEFEKNPVCGEWTNFFWRNAYYGTALAVFFFIPLIFLAVLYVIIVRRLKMAAATSDNKAAIKHRTHVVTMLATVVLCFFVCQLPYRFRSLLTLVIDHEMSMWLGPKGTHIVLFFCRFMIYLHSAINPVLYNLMSRRFRAGFKQILGGTVGCKRWQRSQSVGREVSTTTDVSSLPE